MTRLIDLVFKTPASPQSDIQSALQMLRTAYPDASVLHAAVAQHTFYETPRDAYRALLQAYELTQTGLGWYTAPNDGYLYDHLASHLKEAEEDEGLRRLFIDDLWLKARHDQSDNWLAGYQADLALAWQAADERWVTDQSALVDCVRYALIHQQIRNRSRFLPSPVLDRAVELGLMTQEQAEARRAPNPHAHLFHVPRQGDFSVEEINHLLTRILRTPPSQGLAPHQDGELYTFETLAPAQYDQFIDFILNTPPNNAFGPDQENDELLSRFVPYLTPARIARFLRALENPQQHASAFHALIIFAANTPPEAYTVWLPDLVTFLFRSPFFKDSRDPARSNSWTAFRDFCGQVKQSVPYLSHAQSDELAHLATYNLEASSRRDLIVALAPSISHEQRLKLIRHLLGTLAQSKSFWYDLETLEALVLPLEPSAIVDEVVSTLLPLNPARGTSRWTWAGLLIDLLSKLPDEQRRPLIADLLPETLRMDELTSDKVNLARLAPLLNDAELNLAFDMIRRLPLTERFQYYQYEHAYAPYCLALILPYLTGDTKTQALALALEWTLALPGVVYGFEYVGSPLVDNALILLPQLEGDMYQRLAEAALNAVFMLPEGHHLSSEPRMDDLRAVLKRFTPSLVQRALEIFAVPRVGWVVGQRKQVLNQYGHLVDEATYASLVKTFAPHVPQSQIDAAFWQTLRLSRYSPASLSSYEDDWQMIQTAFLPFASEEAVNDLLGGTPSPDPEATRSAGMAWGRLLGRLSEAQVRMALKNVMTLKKTADNVRARAESLNQESMDVWHDDGYDTAFAARLVDLIPFLPADTWETILRMTYPLQDAYYRACALALLAVRFEGVTRRRILGALHETVKDKHFNVIYQYRRRPNPRCQILAQVASVLDTDILRNDIATALKEKAVEALIVMQAYVPDTEERAALIAKALDFTLTQQEEHREERLKALGSFLTDAQITAAVSTVLAQPETYHTLMHLVGLAYIVRGEADLQTFLHRAYTLRSPHWIRMVVAPLLPKLNAQLIAELLEKTLKLIDDSKDLSNLPQMEDLSYGMKAPLREGALGLLLADLLPLVSDEAVSEIYQAVPRLDTDANRCPALLALMPRVSRHQQLGLLPDLLASLNTFELWDIYGDPFALILNEELAAEAWTQVPQLADLSIRLRLMASLAPHLNTHADLHRLLRDTLTEAFHSHSIYDLLSDWHVFSPPLVSSEHIAEIATAFEDISWHWQWEVLAQVIDEAG